MHLELKTRWGYLFLIIPEEERKVFEPSGHRQEKNPAELRETL